MILQTSESPFHKCSRSEIIKSSVDNEIETGSGKRGVSFVEGPERGIKCRVDLGGL